MSRVIDPIWLCATPEDERACSLARDLNLTSIVRNAQITVYGTGGASIDPATTARALHFAGYVKYFENAYMSGDLGMPARAGLVQGYFDIVSSTYDGMTQGNLNVACYDYLLSEAKRTKPSVCSCLDFGCGPATILESKVASNIPKVFGWDFSSEMRRLAGGKGLSVLHEVELLGGSHQFDVVVAAFVFHYGTVTNDLLRNIFNNLHVGGVLTANFHKNLGLEHFMSTLSQLPDFTLNSCERSSAFGSVIVASRMI